MQSDPKRSVADMHQLNDAQSRTQRPSLLIDLLTGDLGSRTQSNRTPIETPTTFPFYHQSIASVDTFRTAASNANHQVPPNCNEQKPTGK